MSEGKKYDGEKPRMYLLPPKSTQEVAKVLTFGAQKYDEDNWKKLANLQNRYTGAALRHIFAIMDGEDLDPETECYHEAHAICCLLFKLEAKLEARSKEERLRESESVERQKSIFDAEPTRGFVDFSNY
jgi:acetone carboxylase gamma subunit